MHLLGNEFAVNPFSERGMTPYVREAILRDGTSIVLRSL